MDLIGKQLPSVSAADNGKVLGVEDGHWKAVTASQAVEPVIVTINITGHSGDDVIGTWTGATWEELQNAFMHNVAGGINPMTNSHFWFNSTGSTDNLPSINFIGPGFGGSNTVFHFNLMCKSDGTVRTVTAN